MSMGQDYIMSLGQDYTMFLVHEYTMSLGQDYIRSLGQDYIMSLVHEYTMSLGQEFIKSLGLDYTASLVREYIKSMGQYCRTTIPLPDYTNMSFGPDVCTSTLYSTVQHIPAAEVGFCVSGCFAQCAKSLRPFCTLCTWGQMGGWSCCGSFCPHGGCLGIKLFMYAIL